MNDLAWIIIAVLIVAFLWFSGAAIIQPPTQPADQPGTGTGNETTGNSAAIQDSLPVVSLYAANIWANKPDEEYVEIQANYSNKNPVNISGWRLENRDGDVFTIPTGANLPYSAQVNRQESIKLNPGEKAVVITGKSPINTSFHLNACIGYFNRFYEFKPGLQENCPEPHKEPGVGAQNNACFSYLKTLPECQTPILSGAPSDVNFACRDFIEQRLSYAGCVETHKNDAGFFSNEWRVYLEQNKEAWSTVRETIKLFDQNSNLIDEYSI